MSKQNKTARDRQMDEIREAAEADLYSFIRLVAPHRELGMVHEELIYWWTRSDAKDHQLVLLPRDHQKSAMIAYRVAWWITKHPDVTILYVSATSALAEKQLKMIKDILTSHIYRRYWPDMVHPDEGKREKWSLTEIAVDHPKRAEEGVRDSTVMAAGLTTNITGFHCNVAVLDDLVVPKNAYTEEGRTSVMSQYSQLASIETTGSREWVVGTRYNSADLYGELIAMTEPVFDENNEYLDDEPVYELFERVLEDSPNRDGTGEYLWPRKARYDGKLFGFDIAQRARKKAKYLDQKQFYSQYYNDPSDPENPRLTRSQFQYYDRKHLNQRDGYWFFKDKRLSIYCAMDLAFSEVDRKRADSSAIVCIGVTSDNDVYVLDIDRFKTSKISVMFEHAMDMYIKWGFKKLIVETTSAQLTISNEFKVYMQDEGVYWSIDEYRPTRGEGRKQERIDSVLIPRYDNLKIWHYKGGNTQLLEDELMADNPPHEDISDALASAVNRSKPPVRGSRRHKRNNVVTHPRFGGVSV
jgi:hypothetical protein